MAIPLIKATYSLDVETVRRLEEIARNWGVSKSEALRRAIRNAAVHPPAEGSEALRALDALQESLGLDAAQVRTWVAVIKRERHEVSMRREGRRR